MILVLALVVGIFGISTTYAAEPGAPEHSLRRVIQAYDIKPLPTKPFEETNKFKLGRAIFFDPIISGNRDISCATCHLLRRGTSDGLPFSSGTGAKGLAESRSLPPNRQQQPRNAPDLWNRDNNTVTSLFWDGRIEVKEQIRGSFGSPLGPDLPIGFDNLMAAQAIFPILREDELLGLPTDRSPTNLPSPHANLPNEIAASSEKLSRSEKVRKVSQIVLQRLLGSSGATSRSWQVEYRNLFGAAYPTTAIEDFSIIHVANALSHFQETAFATRNAPWDKYLRGDFSAIGDQAKRGALVFYGKGRCAICHSGPLFSDFKFHAIGVQNYGPGILNGRDLGRYHATNNPADKYKFRTPPLRNVTLTAPYFHNGSAETIDDAIELHMAPLFYADKYKESGEFMMDLEQIEAISPILVYSRINLTRQNYADLKTFLKTLEDRGLDNIQRIIPRTVPSGLPVAAIDISSKENQTESSR